MAIPPPNPAASSTSRASIGAKLAALETSAPSADLASETPAGAPPTGGASGASSAPAATSPGATTPGEPAAAAPIDPVRAKTLELLEQKLAATRERRAGDLTAKRARAQAAEAERIRKAAEEDRAKATEERQRWENLGKNGSIVETLSAAGRDPRAVFAELQAEAVKAGTPEAQIEALKARFERELGETKKALDEERKALQDEKARLAREARETRMAADFGKLIVNDAFGELRDEYGDERLFEHARNFIGLSSAQQQEMATALGVRLTNPGKGVTMMETLSILKAAQAEHEKGKTQRRTARTATQASSASPQQPAKTPPVNGTPARRNAGPTVIGNDLATSQATGGPAQPKGASSSIRIQERLRKLGSG